MVNDTLLQGNTNKAHIVYTIINNHNPSVFLQNITVESAQINSLDRTNRATTNK